MFETEKLKQKLKQWKISKWKFLEKMWKILKDKKII